MKKNYYFRRLKKYSLISKIVLLFLILTGCAGDIEKNVVFQVSTISALMEGVYDGEIEVGQLLKEGDFGIGSFEHLDGEMVVLDGKVYQVQGDGTVIETDDNIKVPFATVTWFEPDSQIQLNNVESYSVLKEELSRLLHSPNMFYAFKVEETFEYVQTRSVYPQSKPYPPLVDVTSMQSVFEYRNIEGSLVGFWVPSLAEGVNMPGFHLHFLSKDLKGGGHLLDCRISEAGAETDVLTGFHMLFPENDNFTQVDLGNINQEDIKKAEQ